MPAGLASHSCRRSLALRARPVVAWIASCLIVVQALLAGFVAAQAAVASTSDPTAVICHAFADQRGDASDPGTPDANNGWHLCCAACVASTVATPPPPGLALLAPVRVASSVSHQHQAVAIARGAIRAGPTRAPPTLT